MLCRGARLAQPVLLEAMAADCIPVIVADSIVMPFSSVIDWRRAAIFVQEDSLSDIMDILKSISDQHIIELQRQVSWLYNKYFSTIEKITATTLDIIQDRVYPQWAKVYEHWNVDPSQVKFNKHFFLSCNCDFNKF